MKLCSSRVFEKRPSKLSDLYTIPNDFHTAFHFLVGIKLGIEILDIIPEVYADLLYYLLKNNIEDDQNILVMDCGGGRMSYQGYNIIKEGNREQIIHLLFPGLENVDYTQCQWGDTHFEMEMSDKLNEILLRQFNINPRETKKSKFFFQNCSGN